MRIHRLEMVNEVDIGIKFIEVIRWFFFYLFLELIFPILLDPLDLYVEILGYQWEDMFEIIVLIIIPLLLIYYSDEHSGFANIIALFLYLVLTTNPFYFLYTYYSDLFAILIFLVFLEDVTLDYEGEFVHDNDIL